MKDRESLFANLANITIWLIISAGMLFHFLFIPMLSQELPSDYVEFQGDGILIQLFLSTITLAAQSALLAISLLLGRIVRGNLLSGTSINWVNVLASSCLTFSVLLITLIYWLTIQGAAGPAIALGLLGGALIGVVFTCVTLALKYVLKSAIANHLELEAVI